MPAARPIWKGQIRLSLVSIPVELFSATKTTEKIAFRQIHEPSGKPIHYQKVVAGIGPVDVDEIVKGFEYSKGHYVLLTDEDIEAVKIETRKTFDLVQFVGACEIEPIYFDKPYLVVPTDDLAEDAYRVVRDALKKTQKDRARAAFDARQGISRGAEALRQGHDAGDAALCRGDPKSRSRISRRSRARRRRRTC